MRQSSGVRIILYKINYVLAIHITEFLYLYVRITTFCKCDSMSPIATTSTVLIGYSYVQAITYYATYNII